MPIPRVKLGNQGFEVKPILITPTFISFLSINSQFILFLWMPIWVPNCFVVFSMKSWQVILS